MKAIETVEEHKVDIWNRFDYMDEYTFLDFHNSFAEKKFDSLEDIKTQIEPMFPKVIAKVLTGDGMYIKKTASWVDITRKLDLSDFSMKDMGELQMKSIQFSNLLKEYKSFGELVCKLNNERVIDKSFNIWKGFQEKRVDLNQIIVEVKDDLELLKTFIMEVWESGNEGCGKC